MHYYRITILFLKTDVNTAITTTVVLYMEYYKKNSLWISSMEKKLYIRRSYDDLQRINSILNEAECPMHTAESGPPRKRLDARCTAALSNPKLIDCCIHHAWLTEWNEIPQYIN